MCAMPRKQRPTAKRSSTKAAAVPSGSNGKPSGKQTVLKLLSAVAAAKIKAAAGMAAYAPAKTPAAGAEAVAQSATLAAKPGVERWPVKTGTDPDVTQVASDVVATTVEEMITIPRPTNMQPPTGDSPLYQDHRAAPVETTIWQLDATIIALKQEADGDYHLVLQGASGETMIGEIPTPRAPFVGASSPWVPRIESARSAVDKKLVKNLKPKDFVPMAGKLVPRESMTTRPQALSAAMLPASFVTAPQGIAPAFKTAVKPTKARVTGVGFFDRVHGQMGVSQSNGIELHPILQIEWI
jgi:hypothetical protein